MPINPFKQIAKNKKAAAKPKARKTAGPIDWTKRVKEQEAAKKSAAAKKTTAPKKSTAAKSVKPTVKGVKSAAKLVGRQPRAKKKY